MPTRVLFPFVGDRIGGSQLSTLALIEQLSSEGRFAPLIVVHRDGPVAAYLEAQGLRYVGLKTNALLGEGGYGVTRIVAHVVTMAKLTWFAVTNRVAIVHTNDLRTNLTWALPARLSGKKQVWHQRSFFPSSRLALLLASLASRIVCISRYCEGTLPARLRLRSEVILNPVARPEPAISRDEAKIEVQRNLGCPHGTRIVLFVANLQPQKRPEMLLHAARTVRERYSGAVVFVFVGEDKKAMKDDLMAMVHTLDLADSVFFVGFQQDVGRWMAAADVFVAPQVKEGFGRTLVEAIYARTPIVAARSGGHEEIVMDDRFGVLVSPDSTEAFGDAIVGLLNDPELSSKTADSAFRLSEDRFAVGPHAEAISAVYKRILLRASA